MQIPRHIAIIMDGNRRWEKKNLMQISQGHISGIKIIENIAKYAVKKEIDFLTIYAFSSENWNRPKSEVSYLLKLLEDYLDNEKKEFLSNDICVVVSGNLNKIDESLQNKIKDIEHLTKNNKSLILNVAFSYGSRQEIIDATKKIALAVSNNKIKLEDVDEKFFAKNLYQANLPDPDLLIRTAGELRLSNFFLWQIAYTEFYFSEVFWPDFNKKNLLQAIECFNKRERRYGKR